MRCQSFTCGFGGRYGVAVDETFVKIELPARVLAGYLQEQHLFFGARLERASRERKYSPISAAPIVGSLDEYPPVRGCRRDFSFW
jgi:hypothetical protein